MYPFIGHFRQFLHKLVEDVRILSGMLNDPPYDSLQTSMMLFGNMIFVIQSEIRTLI